MQLLRPASCLTVAAALSVGILAAFTMLALTGLGAYLDDYCTDKVTLPSMVTGISLVPNHGFGADGERVANVVYPTTVRCDFTRGATIERFDPLPIMWNTLCLTLAVLSIIFVWGRAVRALSGAPRVASERRTPHQVRYTGPW